MNSLHQRHKSYVTHKVDSKYRVSVPPDWRPPTGATLYLQISKHEDMPMIRVLGQDAYDDRVQRILDSDLTPAKKQDMLGRLAMHVRETTLNEQGKLLIPKELSNYAGIQPDSEIRLAGRGMHFEVWNKDNHQRLIDIELKAQDEADKILGVF